MLPVVFPNNLGFAIHFATTGLVLGGLFTVILAATSERVKPALVPVAVSIVTVVFAIGQLIGPALAGWMIERTGRFDSAFISSASLMGVGVLLSFLLLRFERTTTRLR